MAACGYQNVRQFRTLMCKLLIVHLTVFIGACASFNPGTLDQLPIRERAQTIEKDGLRVSVAVLNRDEAQQLFGASLHRRGVQPVWLKIENNTDKRYWFMMHNLDPNYFSAREVAYMNHMAMNKKANQQMDAFFSAQGIRQAILPGKTNSGFAFSNETLGTKEVRVNLYADKSLVEFEFYVSVPGQLSDWDRTDLSTIYAEDELVYLETEQELHNALATLPCCTQQENGNGEGDSINVAIIGRENVLKALINTGWDETVFLDDLSSVFGAYYLYGRQPDVQFDKPRRRIDSTMQIRLWLTPLRYNGNPISIGTIKRSVDPDIDAAAIFLAENLITAGRLKRFGYVESMDAVSKDAPRKSFGNQAYWTNGNRLILEISDTYIAPTGVKHFGWDWRNRRIGFVEPPAKVREAAK